MNAITSLTYNRHDGDNIQALLSHHLGSDALQHEALRLDLLRYCNRLRDQQDVAFLSHVSPAELIGSYEAVRGAE